LGEMPREKLPFWLGIGAGLVFFIMIGATLIFFAATGGGLSEPDRSRRGLKSESVSSCPVSECLSSLLPERNFS
jgi:hypothetical protein